MKPQSVTVRVTGIQRQRRESEGTDVIFSQEEERMELTVSGLYSFQNGKHFVIYDEDDGEGNVTRNTVKIYQDSFEVTKRGAAAAHMVFQPGRRTESWYDTPYGRIAMAFQVREVRIAVETAARLKAEASYILEMNGEAAAWCHVCVEAQK